MFRRGSEVGDRASEGQVAGVYFTAGSFAGIGADPDNLPLPVKIHSKSYQLVYLLFQYLFLYFWESYRASKI
jgi:hypothetical protein